MKQVYCWRILVTSKEQRERGFIPLGSSGRPDYSGGYFVGGWGDVATEAENRFNYYVSENKDKNWELVVVRFNTMQGKEAAK